MSSPFFSLPDDQYDVKQMLLKSRHSSDAHYFLSPKLPAKFCQSLCHTHRKESPSNIMQAQFCSFFSRSYSESFDFLSSLRNSPCFFLLHVFRVCFKEKDYSLTWHVKVRYPNGCTQVRLTEKIIHDEARVECRSTH